MQMPATMREMLSPVMQRYQNGMERLITVIQETGGLSYADAEKVATLYLSKKVRAVKIDAIGGGFIIRGGHGQLFEKGPIETALAMLNAGTI